MKIYIKIIILWLIIVCFASAEIGMLFAIMTVPFTLIFLIKWILQLIRKKINIKEILIKTLIILMSYIFIGVVHTIRSENARYNANIVVSQIKAYKAKNGKYPPKLSDINVPEKVFGNGKVYYISEDEKAILYYYSTAIIYAQHSYNFKDDKWEYYPG